MDRPDASDVRAWSRVSWADLGYPAPDPYVAEDDPLNPLVAASIAYVEQVTGRIPLETAVPDELAPLAEQAVRMRTEQMVYQASSDAVEAASDDGIASFTAGSYSETRRDRRGFSETKVLNTWNALEEILWLLMTPEMRDYWMGRVTGVNAPDFAVTEEVWGRDAWTEIGEPVPADYWDW